MSIRTVMFDIGKEPSCEESIRFLREHCPPGGYFGAFSGGKDSVAIKALARMADVPVRWTYNVTTIDPPELVQFIRRVHPDVRFLRQPQHMLTMAVNRGFPTRRCRWCCSVYKESYRPNGSLLMGIRAEESSRRRRQWQATTKLRGSSTVSILPILNWDADYLWRFIRSNSIPYCDLYDEGFERLGCVGCPMAGIGRVREFARWPKIERLWVRAFERIWNRRIGTLQKNGQPWFGGVYFKNWEEMWHWWLYERYLPTVGQMTMNYGSLHAEPVPVPTTDDAHCDRIAGEIAAMPDAEVKANVAQYTRGWIGPTIPEADRTCDRGKHPCGHWRDSDGHRGAGCLIRGGYPEDEVCDQWTPREGKNITAAESGKQEK